MIFKGLFQLKPFYESMKKPQLLLEYSSIIHLVAFF